MLSFEQHVTQVERKLQRALTPQERNLLQLWEMTQETTSAHDQQAAPAAGMAEYAGRFKIVRMKENYEVCFVCPGLMLRPIAVANSEDIVAFLAQHPVALDEMAVRQAIASAEVNRPVQISQTVQLSEAFLRSMGFERM